LRERVLLADGAMGTMLQKHDFSDADFQGHEGCFEILNVTRPEVISEIHTEYLRAGSDCVETNSFGANYGSLGEYGITDRAYELAKAAAVIAREACDAESTPDKPRFALGSLGPGTKLPSLGHAPYAVLRDHYQIAAEGLIDGGVDGFQIETCQDLLQAKAAIIGVKRALAVKGKDLPILVSVTFETNGTLLLGSDVSAVAASIAALGVDGIGMNCGTGPEQMSEQLRYLAQNTGLWLTCMPNAGLPELTEAGAIYPLQAPEFAQYVAGFVRDYGLNLVGGCCGTTPAHIAELAARVGRQLPAMKRGSRPAQVSSLYSAVDLRQDVSYLNVGERNNTNGSKAFREALLADDWDACVEIARQQSEAGAHVLDVCVDYVGRDSARDMRELASRLALAVPLPIMLDSTDPEVLRAGLECLGGRSIINSVNFEEGDGPGSRFAEVCALAKEHGAALLALTIDEDGQARTKADKLAVAERLIGALTKQGFAEEDLLIDTLTFPITTGQEEVRRDGLETLAAIKELSARHPGCGFILGVSNISFGLNPAARQVLNSVFLHAAYRSGLSAAIVATARILPVDRIPDEQVQAAKALIDDDRSQGDPLSAFIELFEGVSLADTRAKQAEELAALPVNERLTRRIVVGQANGMEADLAEALEQKSALAIINEDLLEGMREVGELFGDGRMQLPFVLASAEVMKQAVNILEPHLDKSETAAKGTLVLATVAGDVHDIGKNLVDIILSNNGYKVVNLGIKVPIPAIWAAAEEQHADAIGLSGLLVKSTQVMRNDLIWLSERGHDTPVILGGAALTREYVRDDLEQVAAGPVYYAKDAFEGLRVLDSITTGSQLPEPKQHRARAAKPDTPVDQCRSDVQRRIPVPEPPFWGTRVVKGVSLKDAVDWIDERALFAGQWGLKPSKDGPSYEELVETVGKPRLRHWIDVLLTEDLADLGVVYGYFPCHSRGNVLDVAGIEFDFPRQSGGKRLCLADYFRDEEEAEELGEDVVELQLVTVGERLTQAVQSYFEAGRYRDYLELNCLAAQLAEALAEAWHARVRSELRFAPDGTKLDVLHHQAYQGSRYSFGYPAIPDLADREKLFELLDAERLGVSLTENYQLVPEFSTDAIVVHHPEAKYFNIR
jgi:5-methyltetrahydrofolate--homocysteine methyltransferase